MSQRTVRHDPQPGVQRRHKVVLVPGVVHGQEHAHGVAVAEQALAAVVEDEHPAVAAHEVEQAQGRKRVADLLVDLR